MKNKTTETKLVNKMFSICGILNCYESEPYKDWSYNPPINDFCDFTFIVEGQATFFCGGKKYDMKKGDLFFWNKNTTFRSKGKSGFRYYTIRFFIGKEDKINFLKRLYHPENPDYFYKLFYEAIKIYDQRSYMYNIKIAAIIYNIIASLVTSEISKSNSQIKYKTVEKSIIWLNNNLYNPYLSIEEIAEKSNISVKHFRNIFKEIYEITPIKYITEKRLEKSKELLYYSEYSISEIAEISGFNSTIYFDRVFKKHFGMTPIEYRENFSGN